MTIKYNLDELLDIMWSFYTVSGIRFILFDADFKKILAYPANECAFCTLMRRYEKTAEKCLQSDKKSLLECRNHDGPILYKCHAGLVEAALALKENDTIIGYLMFGQVTDNKSKDEVVKKLCSYCESHGIFDSAIKESAEKINYMDDSQIIAAAKVMEACTSYIVLKELITPESDKLLSEAKKYIDTNISNEIEIYDICKKLKISRTRLYDIFKEEFDIGVAEYIRKQRMQKAKELLKATNIPIWEIAQKVGFSDYTYFGRVYKKFYGKSPREYRK